MKKKNILPQTKDHLLNAYLQPQPEIDIGLKLLKVASSCIDISDGFIQDLGHILKASPVGAEINLAKIPLSSALTRNCSHKDALQLALTGGDDFKLCFTSSLAPDDLPIPNMHCIGKITNSGRLDFDEGELGLTPESLLGFDHFHDEVL